MEELLTELERHQRSSKKTFMTADFNEENRIGCIGIGPKAGVNCFVFEIPYKSVQISSPSLLGKYLISP
jgi:hypothetical protein